MEPSDEEINLAISKELLLDEGVASHLIDVTSKSGVVILSGFVDNLFAKERAVSLSKAISGVKSVIDQTEVRPMHRSDQAILKDVKEALHHDVVTEFHDIKVDVDNGTVVLKGEVESWVEHRISLQVAKGVKGVKKVVNKIRFRPKAERLDREIKYEIERTLATAPWLEANQIDVKVDDAKVSLTGRVGSMDEKLKARVSACVVGVTVVDSSALEIDSNSRDELKRAGIYTRPADSAIHGNIRDALLYDPRVAGFKPAISVENGSVRLEGTVDSLRAKIAAEEDARNTPGVWRVRNHLKVRPERIIDGNEINRHIRKAIERDPYLERYEITTDVTNGKVYLHGEVDNLFEKRHAENVISGIAGVVSISNKLLVDRKWTWKSDTEIMAAIQSENKWTKLLKDSAVKVNVKDGKASLSGKVNTWQERSKATENAFEGGARSVLNELTVEATPWEDNRDYYPTYSHFFERDRMTNGL